MNEIACISSDPNRSFSSDQTYSTRTICHVRRSGRPFEKERTQPECRFGKSNHLAAVRCVRWEDGQVAVAACSYRGRGRCLPHFTCPIRITHRPTVRRFIVCVVDKEFGTSENIRAWRAAITVSLTFGNSNYRANRNAPLGAVFTKLHAWPIQYNTIQYKTYNAQYVTKMLFVGAVGLRCHLTTSVWQTSSRLAANATPSHNRADDCVSSSVVKFCFEPFSRRGSYNHLLWTDPLTAARCCLSCLTFRWRFVLLIVS